MDFLHKIYTPRQWFVTGAHLDDKTMVMSTHSVRARDQRSRWRLICLMKIITVIVSLTLHQWSIFNFFIFRITILHLDNNFTNVITFAGFCVVIKTRKQLPLTLLIPTKQKRYLVINLTWISLIGQKFAHLSFNFTIAFSHHHFKCNRRWWFAWAFYKRRFFQIAL